MTCTRCDGTGFLNLEQVPEETLKKFDTDGEQIILDWIQKNDSHDVQVCDCCGNGETWHGERGCHYTNSDPIGKNGPYAYNGGLCECH